MRQLLLLRHAEAEALQSGQSDVTRCLSEYGRRQALQAAQCLQQHGLLPDSLLISPAARTEQTARIVADALGLAYEPRGEAALYLGDVAALLSAARGSPDTAQCVLLVGHNPALSALAQQLAGGLAVQHSGKPLELPTAGLCRIAFEAPSWRALGVSVIRSVCTPACGPLA